MSNVIAIGCHPGNKKWLDNMLPTLEGVNYPILFAVHEGHTADEKWLEELSNVNKKHSGKNAEVLVLHRNAFSPGVLQAVMDHTEYENILHLHDSLEIKDLDMFRIVFDEHNDKSVSLSHGYLMFMGKYKRSVLAKVGIPYVTTKRQEHSHEFSWTRSYMDAAHPHCVELWPSWTDGDVFVEKFGQKRMVLENEYIKKYKGTWHADMIKD